MAKAELRVQFGLHEMLTGQSQLQRTLLGVFPSQLSDEQKMQYITEQALAVSAEVHEALNETGHKSWASSNHIHREAYVSELRDAWQHLMNLMLVVDVTPTELVGLTLDKHQTNLARIREGYDGVTTKCPSCKRAYDDAAVRCCAGSGEHLAWCEVYGWQVTEA